MVKLQEAENQIVTEYEVYDRRPSDADLLLAAIATHETRLGRTSHLVGRRRRLLLRQKRGGGQSQRSQAGLHP